MEGQTTDEEAVKRVQGGDVESFGVLVERYEARLLRYAKRFFLGSEDVKDVVQDTFVKAYQNIQSFDATKRFSPWIYRIAHNEFVNVLRSRSGKETVSFFDLDVVLPPLFAKEDPEREMEQKELRELMDRKLSTLNAKYREPLVLYYYEDMDYKEIADILKIPVATVGVRLNRGRAMLEKEFTDGKGERVI
jgi:RNA polymerase sigma-70 factor (ECF subfamily)